MTFKSNLIPRYTNSQLTNEAVCSALTYFCRIQQIKPTKLNIHLEYGSAIHFGFETYFKSIKNGFSKQIAKNNAIEAFIDYFSPLDLAFHKQKNLQTGEMALIGYIDDCEIEKEDIIGVELICNRDIFYGEEKFIYGGKIDLLTHGFSDIVKVTDHKTLGAGKYNSYTYDKWSLSRQLIGYAWINNTNLIDVNVIHCLVKPEIYVLKFMFSPNKMKRWEINTIGLIKRLDDKIKLYNYWKKNIGKGIKGLITPEELFPRMSSQCLTQWTGCPFNSLCHQDLPIEEIIINEIDYCEMTEEEKML